MKYLPLTAALALLAPPLQAFEAKHPVVVAPVISTTVTVSGQPIVLPQKNAQILASIFEIAPGVTLPVHKHPFPRYAYVLAGTLRLTNVETRQSAVFKSGDFIVETIGHWHQGENIGSVPLKLLVIDQVEKGKNNTILRK